MSNSLTQLYSAVKALYPGKTYVAEFDQSVDLKSSTPQILIQDISSTPTPNKDKTTNSDILSIRVHVLCSNYKSGYETAITLRGQIENITSTNIEQIDWDNMIYIQDPEIDTHQHILEFTLQEK